MIKNVILDVGKVLVEWDNDTAFKKMGFDEKTAAEVAAATVCSKDWNELDRSAKSNEELLAKFISNAPQYEKEIRMVWENVALPIYQYAYTRKWILGMKRKGFHVYILSNYSAWTFEHTQEALSFLEDTDGALFSFEVHKIKPEPEIYRALLERYDLKAEECVFLDDRRENVEGAESCGIHAIQFTSYEEALQSLREYGVECQ